MELIDLDAAARNDLKATVGPARDQAELKEVQRALENANWDRRVVLQT
ncbi:MAG TPA: hypothetical protein VI636_20890 [Candidatus Angelobacter sp.]